jgi:hypothetical protein
MELLGEFDNTKFKEMNLMANKDKFLEGAQVTKDNQIYGTPNSKSKNGTGDSPNDNVGKFQSQRKL